MTKATTRSVSSAVDSSSTDRAVTLEDFSVNAMNAAADAAVGLGFVKVIIRAVGELSESNAGLAKQLTKHPNYGKTSEADGEMLSDVGLILMATAKRMESIYSKLDGQELAA